MNESNLDEWKSWPPEVVLAAFIQEIRYPILSIKGYAKILSDESASTLHPKAIDVISSNVARMEKLCEEALKFVAKLS